MKKNRNKTLWQIEKHKCEMVLFGLLEKLPRNITRK